MPQEHFYDVCLEWTGERKGQLTSQVLPTAIDVATPPEFPKGMPGIWSPEHLFVAAISSCLMTTFLAVAEHFKLEYSTFRCDATGKLEMKEGKWLVSEVTLKPVLEIYKEEDREKAVKVLNKSEAACLISNSVKSEVKMEMRIEVSATELTEA